MYEVQDYVLLPSPCQEGELLRPPSLSMSGRRVINVAMLSGVESYIHLPGNQELQTAAKI